MVRPCIEHEMLGIVLGRGGTQELGCTFWGQTELSCYDDAFHGKWGMSYKYHERAMVHNEKNLTRVWDVCFNGYTGGMGCKFVDWKNAAQMENWKQQVNNLSESYGNGPDLMCMLLPCEDDGEMTSLPNPVKFHGPVGQSSMIDPDNIYSLITDEMDTLLKRPGYSRYVQQMPDFATLHGNRKNAGMAAVESDTHCCSLAFQGTMEVHLHGPGPGHAHGTTYVRGAGHLGDSYVGCASVRAGKGMQTVVPHGGVHLNRIV